MINDYLVSIIMPVYNAGKYVGAAIQSVLSQSHTNWELIIINDGSTDNSKEVISSFKDSRILSVDQSNQGVSVARNIGLQKMKGDFFCFLDADDEFTTNSIESRLNVFRDDSIYFVDGYVEIFDETLTKLLRVRESNFTGLPFYELIKINPGVFFGPSWMIRRKIGYVYRFEETMTHTEDLWFYFQIVDQGIFSFTNEVILKYRSTPNSAMGNLDKLARGYSQLNRFVLKRFGYRLSVLQKMTWIIRIRKIMAFSYAGNGRIWSAIRYMTIGR